MNCIFCKIVAGEIPAAKVYEDEDFLCFKDINPAARVHLLLIPKKHIPTINDITEADTSLIGKWLIKAKEIAANQGLAADGYRIVMNCNHNGGQEVFHIHLHILGGEKIGHLNCLGSH